MRSTALALAITCAVLIGAGNEDFGFDPAGWLDPFMYFGYFWHYPDHPPALDHDYKASRLPWILPAYASHALLDTTAATYLLVCLTLCAGGMGLYVLVRDTANDSRAAAAVAVAWTACTGVHGIGGWNYHVLASADYFLVASALAFRSATSSPRTAIMSGVFAAAAVHTHLLFVAFAPLLILTYWSGMAPSHHDWRSFGTYIGLAVVGAFGLTVVLGAVNAGTGGDWLFFVPQILRARHLMTYDEWWLETSVWLPTARYLIIPLAFMMAALPTLCRAGAPRASRVIVIQAWAAFALMCVAQFWRRQATLDHDYLAFPLYPYAFACGGIALSDARFRQDTTVPLLAAAIILMPLLLLMPVALPSSMNAAAAALSLNQPIILGPLLFGLAGVVVFTLTRNGVRLGMFAVWFAVLNAWLAPAPSAYGIQTPGYRRQMLELFREADGLTTAFDPRLDGIKYWFEDEPLPIRSGQLSLGDVFDSYVSTRGWTGNLLGQRSRVRVEELTRADLDAAVCVAVLASPGTSAQRESELQARFDSLGAPLEVVTRRHLKRRDLVFDLVLMKRAGGDRHGPPCLRRPAS
jgi:hypothetical protein